MRTRDVRSATLHPAKGKAEVTLRDGRQVDVEYPPTDMDLAEDLTGAGAQVKVENRASASRSLALLLMLLPLLVIGAVGFVLIRRRNADAERKDADGRKISGARLAEGDVPAVRFSDVAGVEEVVDSLEDLLVFLKTPERFERLGAQLPRGVIFHGPPGTGKTRWPRRWPARPRCRSSASRAPTSSRCSSAAAPRASVSCSPTPASSRRR